MIRTKVRIALQQKHMTVEDLNDEMYRLGYERGINSLHRKVQGKLEWSFDEAVMCSQIVGVPLTQEYFGGHYGTDKKNESRPAGTDLLSQGKWKTQKQTTQEDSTSSDAIIQETVCAVFRELSRLGVLG